MFIIYLCIFPYLSPFFSFLFFVFVLFQSHPDVRSPDCDGKAVMELIQKAVQSADGVSGRPICLYLPGTLPTIPWSGNPPSGWLPLTDLQLLASLSDLPPSMSSQFVALAPKSFILN